VPSYHHLLYDYEISTAWTTAKIVTGMEDQNSERMLGLSMFGPSYRHLFYDFEISTAWATAKIMTGVEDQNSDRFGRITGWRLQRPPWHHYTAATLCFDPR